MDIQDYLRQQNREQRQELEDKDKIIKALKKEEYEVKQSIYNELVKVRNIGHSNNILKNIEMLDIVENLVKDLYCDIQDYLDEELEIEYKKELISDYQSQN